jgi:hypothetical protein
VSCGRWQQVIDDNAHSLIATDPTASLRSKSALTGSPARLIGLIREWRQPSGFTQDVQPTQRIVRQDVILQSFGLIRSHSPHDNALDRRGPRPNALWHRCSAEVSTPLDKQDTTPTPFGCMRSAGQSRARSREPGESAQWHRCSHVELSVQIHPPPGLKADWGRPPRGDRRTPTGTPTSPIPGVFVGVRRPTRNARTCRNSTPTNTDGPIA